MNRAKPQTDYVNEFYAKEFNSMLFLLPKGIFTLPRSFYSTLGYIFYLCLKYCLLLSISFLLINSIVMKNVELMELIELFLSPSLSL